MVEALEGRALLSTGIGLDPDFGVGGLRGYGYVPGPNASAFVSFADGTLLADGKYLAAGDLQISIQPEDPEGNYGYTNDIIVVRFNADGTPDTTFGNQGRAIVSVSEGGARVDSSGSAVRVLPNGQILVGGTTNPYNFSSDADANRSSFVAARLNANGTLDTTFGGGGSGYRVVGFEPSTQLTNMAIGPDGRVVLGGNTTNPPPGGSQDVALARLSANGVPDTSFDGDGLRVLNITTADGVPGDDTLNGLAIQPDGRVVFGGSTGPRGSLPNFDNPVGTDMYVARLNPDGSFDNSFNGNGIQRFGVNLGGTNADSLADLAIRPDGRVLLVGTANIQGSRNFTVATPTLNRLVVAQLNPNGTFDGTFGSQGLVVQQVVRDGLNFSMSSPTLLVQPDGSALIGSSISAPTANNYGGLLIRYDAAGQVDPTFASNGIALLSVAPSAGMALDQDGRVMFTTYSRIGRTAAPEPGIAEAGAIVQVGPRGAAITGVELQLNTRVEPGNASNPNFYQVIARRGRQVSRFRVQNAQYDEARRIVTLRLGQQVRPNVPLEVIAQPDAFIPIGGRRPGGNLVAPVAVPILPLT